MSHAIAACTSSAFATMSLAQVNPLDVRFTPESGHVQCNSACPLCARSGHDSQPDLPHLREM
ncbi:MAG: hypothetical protein WCC43_22175, partial [Pseudolabrys sp.]